MRILVLSDIHANFPALEAALASAGQVDEIWCLGDVVGYGPYPDQCIQRLRSLENLVCLMGNHDAAVTGKIALESFNQEARHAIYWTRKQISQENKEWLAGLAEHYVIGKATLAHGSPRSPVWEYILDPVTASQNFSEFDTPVCFVGHSHIPVIFTYIGERLPAYWEIPSPGTEIELTSRSIVNPGSIGQPRDHDPRAAFGIFEPDRLTWTPLRVAYDVDSVQSQIRAAALPERHALRLSGGW